MNLMKEDLLRYKKQLIAGPVFKLAEAVLELLIPTLMVNIIDNAAERGVKYIVCQGLIMLGIAILGFCSALVCQYYASAASQGFGTALRNRLFAKILSMSHADISEFGTAALTNRLTNDVNILQQAVAMLIRLVIRAPFICIGSLVMAMYIDLKLSVIILAALPLLSAAVYMIIKVTVPIYRLVQKRLDRISLIVRENLSGVRVIRSFSKEDHEKKRFADANGQYFNASVRVGKISALLNPMTSVIMNAAVICILWFGKIKIDSGGMTGGEMIAFINYITYMVTALLVIANLVVLFTKAAASYARVKEVLDTAVQDEPSAQCGPRAQDTAAGPSDITLEFRNVTFSYNNANEPALKNISFTLRKGETLGITGVTGSGKTTLINLIMGFYRPSEGDIFLFGRNVNSVPAAELRRDIALAAQKAVLFSGTVYENILLGNDKASEEDVRKAAECAQASGFIEALPGGYETYVERGGANFSGGQRQRMSIARALVRKPRLLILDDSTGALDYVTESKLRAALSQMTYDNLIISAQRTSGISHADKIMVLDDGECVGFGTHGELSETCDVYKSILQLS